MRKPQSEREAICVAQPDVTPERAIAIAECERRAVAARLVGQPIECTCGMGHR